jgi:hypothetical protein
MSKIFNLSRLKKTAAATSKVGVFWIINGNVVSFQTEVIPGQKYADSPFDHVHMWPRVISRYPDLQSKDYDNVPRGRVTFIEGTYIILTGRDWESPDILAKIRKEFSLPANAIVKQDEHYETVPVDPLMEDILNYDKSQQYESVPMKRKWSPTEYLSGD